MLYFLRHDKKPFESSILKHKLSHTNKSNPQNIQIPLFIESIKERKLNQIIEKILKKYKQKNYTLFSREDLYTDKNWQDIHLLTLFMFYKKGWSIEVDQCNLHFPHFITTYDPLPLQKEIDLAVSKVYDKIDPEASKENLQNSYTYNALDLTFFLYYLTTDRSK